MDFWISFRISITYNGIITTIVGTLDKGAKQTNLAFSQNVARI